MKKRILFLLLLLSIFTIVGYFCKDNALVTDFAHKNMPPCLDYPFGTDWLGRNLFFRTLRGISISILIGTISASISTIIAIFLGTISAFGNKNIDEIGRAHV